MERGKDATERTRSEGGRPPRRGPRGWGARGGGLQSEVDGAVGAAAEALPQLEGDVRLPGVAQRGGGQRPGSPGGRDGRASWLRRGVAQLRAQERRQPAHRSGAGRPSSGGAGGRHGDEGGPAALQLGLPKFGTCWVGLRPISVDSVLVQLGLGQCRTVGVCSLAGSSRLKKKGVGRNAPLGPDSRGGGEDPKNLTPAGAVHSQSSRHISRN